MRFDDGGAGRDSALVKRANLMVLGVRVGRAAASAVAPRDGNDRDGGRGDDDPSPDALVDFKAVIVATEVDGDGACTYTVDVAADGAQLPSPLGGPGGSGAAVAGGSRERWPADATLLPMSTAVCLAGVKSEQWRAKWGVICDRDDATGRYVVEVSGPKKITVRFGAVHL